MELSQNFSRHIPRWYFKLDHHISKLNNTYKLLAGNRQSGVRHRTEAPLYKLWNNVRNFRKKHYTPQNGVSNYRPLRNALNARLKEDLTVIYHFLCACICCVLYAPTFGSKEDEEKVFSDAFMRNNYNINALDNNHGCAMCVRCLWEN